MKDRNAVVYFRFTSRGHPGRGAGGRAGLRPGGSRDTVRVQEEPFVFLGAALRRQRLLQTNQLAGHRVGRERADDGPGGELGRIAVGESGGFCLTVSPSSTKRHRTL